MKLPTLLTLSLSLLGSTLWADSKLIDVEGASITYKTSSHTKFGPIESKINATEHLYLKKWGAVQLHEEQSTTESTMGGNHQEHEMNLVEDGMAYSVNFEAKKIEKMPLALAPEEFAQYNENWRDSLEKTGAKKIGTDKVAGYTCEVWEMAQFGAKTCVYKGLALRTVVNFAGTTSTTIATKVDIGVPSAKYFKLPDYPVVDASINAYQNQPTPKTPKTSPSKSTKTSTHSKPMDACTLMWKSYFDCMGDGEKDLAGYQNAIACQDKLPDTQKCPPPGVTAQAMQGNSDNSQDVQEDMNKMMESMKGLFNPQQ